MMVSNQRKKSGREKSNDLDRSKSRQLEFLARVLNKGQEQLARADSKSKWRCYAGSQVQYSC
jgi:hypothetical protein